MKELHNKLLQRSRHYRTWHEHPYHQHHHWLVAFLSFLIGAYAIAGAWQVTFREQELLSITLLVPSARAQSASCTRYVATTGSDTNDGRSEANPFRTIQKAVDSVNPGDVVCVKAGEYKERVIMKKSGQIDKPIVFQGEFNGDRSNESNWKTVIDASEPVINWLPAPEVGFGVYKTTSLNFNPRHMAVDNKMIVRIRDDYMSSGQGFTYLAMPAVNTYTPGYVAIKINWWDGIEALYGYKNGVTYIRFRNGDDPNKMNIKASPAGSAIQIENISYVIVRGFKIAGAQDGVLIKGNGAKNNIVEENFIMHGQNRVSVINGAASNHIRNNEMTMNYFGYDKPGAWREGTKKEHAIKTHIYQQYKLLVSDYGGSDDHGVLLEYAGDDNQVYGNHIFQGLIGVYASDYGNTGIRNLKVYNNIIHNMSSICLLPIEGLINAQFFDNLVYDCNINIRIHEYDEDKDFKRSIYVYRNRFYNPPGTGDHIFVHWNKPGLPANFKHPDLWFYHNSFVGGYAAISLTYYGKDDGIPKTHFLNNIFSAERYLEAMQPAWHQTNRMGIFDYNWVGGNDVYSSRPAWFGSHNIYTNGQKMWDDSQIPDFLLPVNSTARDAGIDLSKSFTIDGKNFPALPGMTIGYAGADGKPDMGATQSEQGGCISTPEVCDGKDNDCDNQIDEGNVCGGDGTTNQPPRNLFLRYLGPTP